MLCRTASDLLWMARHIERVDNCARLIDYAHRVALLPDRLEKGRALTESWGSALSALGWPASGRAAHAASSAGRRRKLVVTASAVSERLKPLLPTGG